MAPPAVVVELLCEQQQVASGRCHLRQLLSLHAGTALEGLWGEAGNLNWRHSFSELPGACINLGSGCEVKSLRQAAEEPACLVLTPRTSQVAWASHATSGRWTLWPGIYLRFLLVVWFRYIHHYIHQNEATDDAVGDMPLMDTVDLKSSMLLSPFAT